MTSKLPHPREAFVWTWLPTATEPVVAGRLAPDGERIQFIYGRSYRDRPDAIPLYLPELPLRPEPIAPLGALTMASAIRDGAPDAWGRRVILNKTFGVKGEALDGLELDELVFLLESGSDRIGALDFQTSATKYAPRGGEHATIEELLASAEKVEKNLPLTPELDQALHHGSSIGGARPKAVIAAGAHKYVAKFSSTTDTYSVVKAEYIAMRLAALAGLLVAPVQLLHAAGKDVLLVERFDRERVETGWRRRAMVSALTILELDEMQARYASYQDLAEAIRFRFADPNPTLRELFARLTLNILVGNVDDHARNHAAFWDGAELRLTPAYDICPQGRAGEEASQAMLIVGQRRSSQISTCFAAASDFHLSVPQATAIVAQQLETIGQHWGPLCEEANLGQVDRALFWGRQFLNPFAFYGLEGPAAQLTERANAIRAAG
ncbi:HipA domain-containing protein [Phenylobacterium sp.]|jgi:serine/threonine-protein kinase HipA|uniref:type II toxin-antitoxin system HipA family toxin n=1 Tax=Phenylobacterium sp. TaxID=1871053 RepID=UPI002E336E1F|nr:HipA domain-containing protein [Phenylobacterium sp.]HEX4709136.1 HipA domain-containing protein [Phenylobacterium sp.]